MRFRREMRPWRSPNPPACSCAHPAPSTAPSFFSLAEGKTDYRARRRLVVQDKNKYQAPKYRLVVRLTGHYVICQIVYTTLTKGGYCDNVLASAYSSELPRYGVKNGLKNYSAAYATGLLVARRVLAKLKLDSVYKGNEDVDAKVMSTKTVSRSGLRRTHWVSSIAEKQNPFRCYLDVGIRATTTGARVFGALKGAVDGGLDIPHNEKRFPGYNRESKEYDAEFHKARIFGGHVTEYMEELMENDEESFQLRFRKWIKDGIEYDMVEEYYANCHAAIRADPSPAPKSKYVPNKKFKKPARLTGEQRAARVQAKKLQRIKDLQATAGGDDE
jgi:large subunit ribosomal protein L5e